MCIANDYTAVDFYNSLLPVEKGIVADDPKEKEKQEQMKDFLMREYNTTKISGIDKDSLKEKLGNVTLIERIGFRKQVGITYVKAAIQKGAVIRRENKMATILDEKERNKDFCIPCLHYSVSEGAGVLRVKIVKRSETNEKIGVRTVDAEASSPKDFKAID